MFAAGRGVEGLAGLGFKRVEIVESWNVPIKSDVDLWNCEKIEKMIRKPSD